MNGVMVALLCGALVSGCATYDESRCGGRGYVIREGMCEGFGPSGFRWERFAPRNTLLGMQHRLEAGKEP